MSVEDNQKHAGDGFTNGFITVASALIALTAAFKLASLFQPTNAYMNNSDPLFKFATNKTVMICAIAMEVLVLLTVAYYKRRSVLLQLTALLWFSSVAGFYRVSLKVIGYKGECACLGTWWQWIGVSDNVKNTAATMIVLFLLIGSTAGLIKTSFIDRFQRT